MADYSNAYELPCGCSVLSGHSVACSQHHLYKATRKGLENNMEAQYAISSLGHKTQILSFRCNNGCGTLVWDIDAHMKNVCVND